MNKDVYIQKLFNQIAQHYDKTNNFISLGRHLSIKKKAIDNILVSSPKRIIDLCCGTGDIAILLAQKFSDAEIYAVDFSENMIKIAKQRTVDYSNIKVMQADILKLDFEDDYFDFSFISFGLRNVVGYKKALLEMKRVVKKGGYIASLDTGKPNILVKVPFDIYFQKIVPFLGKFLQGDKKPLEYLASSSLKYTPQMVMDIMNEIELKDIKNYNYMFGTIAQQIGRV